MLLRRRGGQAVAVPRSIDLICPRVSPHSLASSPTWLATSADTVDRLNKFAIGCFHAAEPDYRPCMAHADPAAPLIAHADPAAPLHWPLLMGIVIFTAGLLLSPPTSVLAYTVGWSYHRSWASTSSPTGLPLPPPTGVSAYTAGLLCRCW
uniref:Uncharacterized protein n=1 Tax=Oryza sativa subsp. japonica TaxID=39947 RepID=Q6YT92_ORYSJ|nr:hypothetical protein [Oryza sativa Japonica Group]